MAVDVLATVTYNPTSEGWPSFYSYFPEYIKGMNSYLYTFQGGNLFRHNVNPLRNNYYGNQSFSTITGVLNQKPLEIKLYKTLSYESNTTSGDTSVAAWSVESLITDLSAGSMASTYFKEKEGEWFSYIRNLSNVVNWRLRSSHGLGQSTSVTGAGTGTCVITFNTALGSIISIGDSAFQTTITQPPAVSPTPDLMGVITSVNNVAGAYSITINNSGTAAINAQQVLFIKNPVAESQGARGYFLQFILKNTATVPVELFAVSGSVMKSFP